MRNFKKRLLPFLALMSTGMFLCNVTSCQQGISETIDNKSFEFNCTVANLQVGEHVMLDLVLKNVDSVDELEFNDDSNGEFVSYSTENGKLKVVGLKEGETIITAYLKDEPTIKSYVLIKVNKDTTKNYLLDVDTSKCKTKYLVGETFDSSYLKVLAYEVVEGEKVPESLVILQEDDYTLSITNGEALKTKGNQKITIKSDKYGVTSYEISVSDSVKETSLSVKTNSVITEFTKGQKFTSNGLVVASKSIVKTLESDGSISQSEVEEEITSFKTSILPGTSLDSLGLFEVIVTTDLGECSYFIQVVAEDNSAKTLMNNLINTRNSGYKIYSSIPTTTHKFGLSTKVLLKNKYALVTEYEKNGRDEIEKSSKVSNESGLIKDKNNSLYEFDMKNDEIVASKLLKQNLANKSYWDYREFINLKTLKEFNPLDFVTKTMSEEKTFYKEIVDPLKTLDDYPLIKSLLTITNTSKDMFAFCKSYEFEVVDGIIRVRADFKNYGYVELTNLTQEELADDSRMVQGLTKSYEVPVDIAGNVQIIKNGVNENNYTSSSQYLTQYFTNEYFYYEYDPIMALAGLTSMGYLRLQNSTSTTQDGIYKFQVTTASDGSLIVDESKLSAFKLDTETIKYTDQFIAYAGAYLSTTLGDIFGNNTTLSTFKEVQGLNNIYRSESLDAIECIMSYFFGSDDKSKNEAIANGYTKPCLVPVIDSGRLTQLTIFLLDNNFFGYGKVYTNFGTTKLNYVDEFIQNKQGAHYEKK